MQLKASSLIFDALTNVDPPQIFSLLDYFIRVEFNRDLKLPSRQKGGWNYGDIDRSKINDEYTQLLRGRGGGQRS